MVPKRHCFKEQDDGMLFHQLLPKLDHKMDDPWNLTAGILAIIWRIKYDQVWGFMCIKMMEDTSVFVHMSMNLFHFSCHSSCYFFWKELVNITVWWSMSDTCKLLLLRKKFCEISSCLLCASMGQTSSNGTNKYPIRVYVTTVHILAKLRLLNILHNFKINSHK